MVTINFQLFGGRGGASGKSGGGGNGRSAGAVNKQKSASGGGSSGNLPTVQKKTPAQIKNMTRKEAVAAAKDIFIRNNMKMGLSQAEATRRFNALIDGNTTAQLKKYIKRNQ